MTPGPTGLKLDGPRQSGACGHPVHRAQGSLRPDSRGMRKCCTCWCPWQGAAIWGRKGASRRPGWGVNFLACAQANEFPHNFKLA